jgi:hypothetical protein
MNSDRAIAPLIKASRLAGRLVEPLIVVCVAEPGAVDMVQT